MREIVQLRLSISVVLLRPSLLSVLRCCPVSLPLSHRCLQARGELVQTCPSEGLQDCRRLTVLPAVILIFGYRHGLYYFTALLLAPAVLVGFCLNLFGSRRGMAGGGREAVGAVG